MLVKAKWRNLSIYQKVHDLIYKFFNSRGTVCSCNASKKPNLFNSKWPFNKLKHFFMGVKESNMLDSGLNPRGQLMTASEYANQIAEIQKQQKTKRHTSMSSDNFSSSRSDSWRQHQFLVNPNQRHHHHHHHRWEFEVTIEIYTRYL